MNKKAMIVALSLTASPVLAADMYQQDGYFGVQLNLLEQETDMEDLEPTAFQTRFGVQMNPNIALEARLGYGLSDDELEDGGNTLTIDPEWVLGAYLKLGLDKSMPVAPYVLLGHSTATAERTVEVTTPLGGTVRDSEDVTASDPSFGAGVEVNLDANNALNAEWVQLDDDDDFDLTTINIGYVHRF